MVVVTDQETSYPIKLTTVFVDPAKTTGQLWAQHRIPHPKPTDISSSMNRAAEVRT
jgi:hypothetical protein